LPGSGIVLGLSKRGGEQLESTGIFTGTLNGAGWQAIAGPDSILIAHSIHGTLTAQKNELYLLKDGVRNLLTNTMHFPSAQPADWLADGRVAVIQNSEGRVRVVMLDPSNGSSVMLDDLGLTPMTLYPSPDPARIYWGAGECNGAGCFPQTILISRTDGSGTQPLPFTGQPAFAADGKMAFVSLDGKNQLTLVSGAGESYSIPLFGNRLTDLAWSPDGNTLAIITAQVSDYSGRVLESRLNFIELPGMVRTVVSATEDVIERAVWSPDGKYMLVVHRAVEEADYRLEFAILDADRQYELQTGGFQLTSSEYLFPHPVYWMP
jgi:hypothetical protein